jgi:hypothetical protein
MKTITINSKIIFLLTALVFVVYVYFSYTVFSKRDSPALIEGENKDADGVPTQWKTATDFFKNIGMVSLLIPILLALILVLVFVNTS